MVAHYFHTVGIGRFEYGARFHLPTTSSDGRALIRRSARARLPPSGPFWDRLMVGRESLALVIVVRIHVPEPRGAPRLVLGMLLQSIAARFDPEAPYRVTADLR